MPIPLPDDVAPVRERGLKYIPLSKRMVMVHSRYREGAWIEIMPFMEMVTPKQVAPVRERGLKYGTRLDFRFC